MPRINEATATITSINSKLPDEISSTTSASTSPIPVKVTVPTIIPAVDVAIATPIMLRAPAIRPVFKSPRPWENASCTAFRPRNQALSGRCVTRMMTRNIVAQKAESAGDSSSIIRFQISAATGKRKCKPLLIVGPVSGHFRMGEFGSSRRSSG